MPLQTSGVRIKPNHSSYGPQIIVAVNTARKNTALDKDGRLIRGSFLGCHAVCSRLRKDCRPAANTFGFRDTKSFWEWFYRQTTPHRTTWLIGYNMLAELTLLGWTHEIDSSRLVLGAMQTEAQCGDKRSIRGRSSSILCVDSPPLIVRATAANTGGQITIVDLQNWHRENLVAIGRTVGIHAPEQCEWNDPDPQWTSRTRIYASVIHDAFIELVKWVKDNDLGIFRFTAAGQAMAAFRHKFYTHQIYIHDNQEVRKLERRAFYGGRTEVFRRGYLGQTVYQLDVNALYPYIMHNTPLPCKMVEYGSGGTRGQELLENMSQDMVACVGVETPIGLYPYRVRGTTLYPIGSFNTVLCGEELTAAVRNGVVKHLGQWAVYDRMPIFAAYVAELSQQKAILQSTGRTLWSGFVKLLLNSLYGKFAQLSPEWVNRPDRHDMLPWTRDIGFDEVQKCYTDRRAIGSMVQVRAKERESPKSFPAISAFVTAAGRQYMHTLRTISGAKNVYYQGCDSLIVNAEGRNRLDELNYLDPIKMGKMKVEMVADDAAIFACQDYRIGDKTVVAGRRPDGAYIDRAKMRQLKESALAALFHGRAEDTILCENLPWTPSGTYYKGVVQPDGWIASCELTGDVSSTVVSTSR